MCEIRAQTFRGGKRCLHCMMSCLPHRIGCGEEPPARWREHETPAALVQRINFDLD
jgi:hypothetical protein